MSDHHLPSCGSHSRTSHSSLESSAIFLSTGPSRPRAVMAALALLRADNLPNAIAVNRSIRTLSSQRQKVQYLGIRCSAASIITVIEAVPSTSLHWKDSFGGACFSFPLSSLFISCLQLFIVLLSISSSKLQVCGSDAQGIGDTFLNQPSVVFRDR